MADGSISLNDDQVATWETDYTTMSDAFEARRNTFAWAPGYDPLCLQAELPLRVKGTEFSEGQSLVDQVEGVRTDLVERLSQCCTGVERLAYGLGFVRENSDRTEDLATMTAAEFSSSIPTDVPAWAPDAGQTGNGSEG